MMWIYLASAFNACGPDPSAGEKLKQDQGLEPGWRQKVSNRYGLNLESTKLG
jgi:hypothetical protein